MLIQQAEESFRRGVTALRLGRRLEALTYFETAVELERRLGGGTVQPRYLSYLGLCLVMSQRDPRQGERLCRAASKAETFDADVHCNYGRVLLAKGSRRQAYKQFVAGLRVDSDHRTAREELRRMGMRRRPVLPFLRREHPFNVVLGRLRSACDATARPAAA